MFNWKDFFTFSSTKISSASNLLDDKANDSKKSKIVEREINDNLKDNWNLKPKKKQEQMVQFCRADVSHVWNGEL